MDKTEYYELCKIPAVTSEFNTEIIFKTCHDDSHLSPIDLFILNTKELNKIVSNEYTPALGNLILLGYISATESYLRTLIRRLILVDEYSQTIIAEKNVSYAAAYHHSKELLPEALLENYSFANPYNIFNTLKDIIGIKKNIPSYLMSVSKEFFKICELRHCCVHRFGKLGSKNAVKLGIDKHSCYLEKPISLKKEHVDELANIVTNFVKAVNNYVYESILDRISKNKNNEKKGEKFYKDDLTWNFNKDKKRFKKYYDIFSTIEDTYPSMSIKEAYNKFRKNPRD